MKGDALLCEGNYISRRVLLEQLARADVTATAVSNGKSCIKAVQERMLSGRPFDIILLDMHMPEMDGAETARWLMAAGNTAPVVALSAFDMSAELDTGISSQLIKPIKHRRLRECLDIYICRSAIDRRRGLEQYDGDEKIYSRILNSFAANSSNALSSLKGALGEGDMLLAYRTVHTLKSTAGLIGAARLASAAYAAEHSLAAGGITDEIMSLLEREFTAVTDELQACGVQGAEREVKSVMNRKKTLMLLDKLEPLLKCGNSESMEFLDEAREYILGASQSFKDFVTQIESCDFDQAFDTLNAIKRYMRSS